MPNELIDLWIVFVFKYGIAAKTINVLNVKSNELSCAETHKLQYNVVLELLRINDHQATKKSGNYVLVIGIRKLESFWNPGSEIRSRRDLGSGIQNRRCDQRFGI